MIFSVPTKLDKKIKTCFKEIKVCSGKPHTFLLYNWLNLDALKPLILNKTTEEANTLEQKYKVSDECFENAKKIQIFERVCNIQKYINDVN